MKVPTLQDSTHPPPFVCIQSVYVGKKDEEKEDSYEEKKSRTRRNKQKRRMRRRKFLRDSDDDEYMDDEDAVDDLPNWNRSGRRWNRLRSFLSRIMT